MTEGLRMRGVREIVPGLIVSEALLNVRVAFADMPVPDAVQPANVLSSWMQWFFLACGCLVVISFMHLGKKKGVGPKRGFFLVICVTTLSLIVGGILCKAVDVMPPADPFMTGYGNSAAGRLRAAFRVIGTVYQLKSSAQGSLAGGSELQTGIFACDSPFIAEDFEPYAELHNLHGSVSVVIVASPDVKVIRSPDALPASLYIGLHDHRWGWLDFIADMFRWPPSIMRQTLTLEAKAKGWHLFKNVRGEFYDGGNTVLMKVF